MAVLGDKVRMPAIAGVIERRLLINYRVDPDAIRRVLPAPFTPDLVDAHAIAGICLIQLRVRPAGLPASIGVRSSNGAHRIAVVLPDGSKAVYVPRRDTDSRLNQLVGGRLFPGVQHPATITASDSGDRISLDLDSADGDTHVGITASVTNALDPDSIFASVDEVSTFFEEGSLGFSDTSTEGCFDGLELRATNWSVTPLKVERVESSFFDDHVRFPAGSAQLDNALLMRDIDHTWHAEPTLTTPQSLEQRRPISPRITQTSGKRDGEQGCSDDGSSGMERRRHAGPFWPGRGRHRSERRARLRDRSGDGRPQRSCRARLSQRREGRTRR